MSQLEDRVRQVLTTEPSVPSPDLFARVVGSIEADRLRRRTLALILLGALCTIALVTVLILILTPTVNGALAMPWWILEVATDVVLIAIAVWLGPFIKRFGRAYAADVFHDNPLTGKSYIVLTDIVYYLIFTAYILFTLSFAPQTGWDDEVSELVTPGMLSFEVSRIAGILLIIGLLHGLNIVLMPVLGRLFSLNRRVSENPTK